MAATASAPDFKEIIERLLPDILISVHSTFSRLHHRSPYDEVPDLCQQIVVLLMENDFHRLRSFDHLSSQRTWLTAVVRNHVINYLQRQKPIVSLDEFPDDAISCPAMEEQKLIAQEQRDRLQAALRKLTRRELELFDLCYVAELNTAEIAAKMSIKLQSVRRRKHSLVKKLQEFLQDRSIIL
jgi:RNA polymerase sigma factor (sigma-70 family)